MKRRTLLAAVVVLALVWGNRSTGPGADEAPVLLPGRGSRTARADHRRVREGVEQKNPQIQVEPVFAGGYTEAYAKTLAAIRGGTAGRGHHAVPEPERHPRPGHRHPADLIAADAAQVKMDDFFPAFMLNSTQGGKVWSIPFQRSTPVMYYNKDAFKEVGLDPNKPPQTQAELVAAAKKLTKQEGGGPLAGAS